MADATRYNGAVSRLHAITAAVMLLTRIRAAAAASPTLGPCPFSHRAYREASSGHLQKIFDRAGFDTSRGAMWFTKHDDAPLDCDDCHHVSSASAYGCPMLVRALSSPPSLTRNNDVITKADVTLPSFHSQPTKGDRERAWERAWERASSSKTDPLIDTAVLATDATTVGSIPHETSAPRPARDRSDVFPDLSLASVSPSDATVVPVPDGEHLSCELNLGFRDVALVLGCTPPPSRYFGITPHLYRTYNGNEVHTHFTPLGDSLSYGVGPSTNDPGGTTPAVRYTRLATAAAKVSTNWYANDARAVVRNDEMECSGQPFATLVGRSRHTMSVAMDALEATGVINMTAVNPYGLDSPNTKSDEHTHAVLFRDAAPSNATDWNAYAESPPFVVLRLTPREPTLAFDPFHAMDWLGSGHDHHPGEFPRAVTIAKKTRDERGLKPAVEAVAAKIAESFGDVDGKSRVSAKVSTSPLHVPHVTSADDDVGDVTYVDGPDFTLNPDGSRRVFIVGVNHAAAGNGHAADLFAFTRDMSAAGEGRRSLVASFTDSAYAGTALRWSQLAGVDSTDASNLYVVQIARRCPEGAVDGDGVACVEAKVNGSLGRVYLEERAYAQLDTTVGPGRNNMVAPVIVEVTMSSPEIVGPGGSSFGQSWF